MLFRSPDTDGLGENDMFYATSSTKPKTSGPYTAVVMFCIFRNASKNGSCDYREFSPAAYSSPVGLFVRPIRAFS